MPKRLSVCTHLKDVGYLGVDVIVARLRRSDIWSDMKNYDRVPVGRRQYCESSWVGGPLPRLLANIVHGKMGRDLINFDSCLGRERGKAKNCRAGWIHARAGGSGECTRIFVVGPSIGMCRGFHHDASSGMVRGV